jgi:cyclopropane-fatty-acyl-phospholipid synthase
MNSSMNSSVSPPTAPSFPIPQGTPAAARTVLKLLQRLTHGSLAVQLPDGSMQSFGTHGAQPHAALRLNNWNACSAALKSGDIGFAESYIAGDWTTPNLTELLRVLVANRKQVEDVVYGSWAGRLLYRIKHLLNRNTKANSQKNIHAHYDLGNAFYELWLDDTMNYSSALFAGDLTQTMQQAQYAKVRRALSMAGVTPGSRVLEIGCGWGALAEMATTEFEASVTGVTLSTEQLAFAQARMARLGVASSADLRLQDYRDITDTPFDAICSIEMVEAVGREYWPTYFQALNKLLKPGGRACVQSIVIDDALFERYLTSTDFIQQYIFPGGCLPCPREFRAQARAAGFDVVDEFSFGHDYAETLRRWRETFMHEKQQVLANGFDERFIRIWEFYLAYCEAAFAENNTDVVQYTILKI